MKAVPAGDAKSKKPAQKAKLRWVIIAVLSVVFIAGAALVALRYYPRWSEKRLVARGRELLNEKKYTEASLTAQRALQFNRRSIGATQLLIDLGEVLHTSDVIEARQHMLELQPQGLDNRLRLAEI